MPVTTYRSYYIMLVSIHFHMAERAHVLHVQEEQDWRSSAPPSVLHCSLDRRSAQSKGAVAWRYTLVLRLLRAPGDARSGF